MLSPLILNAETSITIHFALREYKKKEMRRKIQTNDAFRVFYDFLFSMSLCVREKFLVNCERQSGKKKDHGGIISASLSFFLFFL